MYQIHYHKQIEQKQNEVETINEDYQTISDLFDQAQSNPIEEIQEIIQNIITKLMSSADGPRFQIQTKHVNSRNITKQINRVARDTAKWRATTAWVDIGINFGSRQRAEWDEGQFRRTPCGDNKPHLTTWHSRMRKWERFMSGALLTVISRLWARSDFTLQIIKYTFLIVACVSFLIASKHVSTT